jgi:hypothetical protein
MSLLMLAVFSCTLFIGHASALSFKNDFAGPLL